MSENTWSCDPIKIHKLVSGQLLKTRDLDEFYTWAGDMVMWYWSADALFWQLSIDHEMDLQYELTKANVQARSVIWSKGKQRALCCATP